MLGHSLNNSNITDKNSMRTQSLTQTLTVNIQVRACKLTFLGRTEGRTELADDFSLTRNWTAVRTAVFSVTAHSSCFGGAHLWIPAPVVLSLFSGSPLHCSGRWCDHVVSKQTAACAAVPCCHHGAHLARWPRHAALPLTSPQLTPPLLSSFYLRCHLRSLSYNEADGKAKPQEQELKRRALKFENRSLKLADFAVPTDVTTLGIVPCPFINQAWPRSNSDRNWKLSYLCANKIHSPIFLKRHTQNVCTSTTPHIRCRLFGRQVFQLCFGDT